jgi:hypothetical protein
MNKRPVGENPISRMWRDLQASWKRLEKEGSALARGSPLARLAFLFLLVVMLFLCLLLFSTDLLSFDMGILEKFQNVRLTLQPYTATPTVTATLKPTRTETPTSTSTPKDKLPSPTITATIMTPTFTVTATPTNPHIPLRTLQPDSEYAWQERLTDPWLWRHVYALIVGSALAGWLMVLYVRELYGIRRFVRSAGLLMRMLLMMPIGTLHIMGGKLVDVITQREFREIRELAVLHPDGKIERKYEPVIVQEVRVVGKDWTFTTPEGKIIRKHDKPVTADVIRRTLRLLRIGIPARLIVEEDSCAVIEGNQKQSLVIGPTAEPVVLLGFTRLRRAVDLRDQVAEISVRQPTQDGVPLNALNAQFVFSVYRGEPTNPETTYVYNEEAIFNLVYRFWLDGEWISEMTARIAAELRQFIAAHKVNTFLAYLSQNTDLPVNPEDFDQPFNSFVEEFNALAKERGIQIGWGGNGIWRLPTETDLTDRLENWQKNIESLLKLPEEFPDEPSGGEYNQDLINLIQQIPLSLLDPYLTPTVISRRSVLNVIEKYRDKLNEALQLYQKRGQIPPDKLVEVIEQLNRLILRRV